MADQIAQYIIIMDITNDTPQSFQRLRRYTISDPVGGDIARQIMEDVTPEGLAAVLDHAAIVLSAQVQRLNAQIVREREEAAAALTALDVQWQARLAAQEGA